MIGLHHLTHHSVNSLDSVKSHVRSIISTHANTANNLSDIGINTSLSLHESFERETEVAGTFAM